MFFLNSIYKDIQLLTGSLTTVYQPHFSFKKENRRQWFLLIAILFCHIIQAILLVYTNTCLSQIFGILNPNLRLSTFLKYTLQYIIAVSVVVITSVMNVFLNGKLTLHLDEILVKQYVQQTLDKNAYLGSNFLPGNQQKVVNSSVFLSHDIPKTNSLVIRSLDSLISTTLSFIAGLYGLWQLSMPHSFVIASYSITIPALIPLGAIVYSLLYCAFVDQIGYQLRDATKNKKEFANLLESQSNFVDKNSETIALLKGNEREKKTFNEIITKGGGYQSLLIRLQSALACCITMNVHLQTLVAIILMLPQLISRKLSEGNITAVSSYFGKVVGFFTWHSDNCEDLSNIIVLSDRFALMNEQIHRWDKLQCENTLLLKRSPNKFIINSITLKSPHDKKAFLQLKDLEFNNAKVTLIQGPSGCGKSSFLKALAHLWPYVEGEAILPADEKDTYFIPQKAFFPRSASLFEAIAYPDKCQNDKKIRKATDLLKKVNLHKLLLCAHEQKDWSKILSGGEQQKIAILRAIWHKPKLLFMDEPFSGMDEASKTLCENLLLESLDTTTIIYIDHQADKMFYDYLVTFDHHKSTQERNLRPQANTLGTQSPQIRFRTK